jgi:hypothetical protein
MNQLLGPVLHLTADRFLFSPEPKQLIGQIQGNQQDDVQRRQVLRGTFDFFRFVVDVLNNLQNMVIGGITQHGDTLTHDFDIKPFFQTTTPMSALMRLYPPANPVVYPPCV